MHTGKGKESSRGSMRVRESAEPKVKANNLKVMPNTSKVVIIELHQSRFKRSMSDLINILSYS